MKYSRPNLPENNVKKMVASYTIDKRSSKKLTELGIEIVYSLDLPEVDKRISYHTDLGICHVEEGVFFTCPSAFDNYKDMGSEIFVGEEPHDPYPFDSGYNVCIFGKYAIHNFKNTDKKLRDHIKNNYEMIDVKQSYTKCALSIAADDFVITQDRGLAKTLEKNDLDVLLIDEKKIQLDGFEYGFIGGASFLFNKNTWIINGALDKLDSCYNIENELKKKGIGIICLNDDYPVDVGSFITIFEGE